VPAPELAACALNALRPHRWLGNLIELDAVLSRALCLSAKAARALGVDVRTIFRHLKKE